MGSPVPGDGACLVRLGRHQEGTKVGNCRRMSLNLHTFPAKSTLRMIMGDFHSLSPGIAVRLARYDLPPCHFSGDGMRMEVVVVMCPA